MKEVSDEWENGSGWNRESFSHCCLFPPSKAFISNILRRTGCQKQGVMDPGGVSVSVCVWLVDVSDWESVGEGREKKPRKQTRHPSHQKDQ